MSDIAASDIVETVPRAAAIGKGAVLAQQLRLDLLEPRLTARNTSASAT